MDREFTLPFLQDLLCRSPLVAHLRNELLSRWTLTVLALALDDLG